MHSRLPFTYFLASLTVVLASCGSPQATSTPGEATSTQAESPQPEPRPSTPTPTPTSPEMPGTVRSITLFGDGHKTLGEWNIIDEAEFISHGKVRVDGDTIVLGAGSPATGIRWTGPFPRDNYEVTLEAMRVEGGDFFCGMTFPIGREPCTLIMGGWGGSMVGLSNIDGMHAAENETTLSINFKDDRWYRIKLRVSEETIAVWLDGESIINLRRKDRTFTIWPQQEPAQPFGIVTWYTKAALKNIRVRRITDGK